MSRHLPSRIPVLAASALLLASLGGGIAHAADDTGTMSNPPVDQALVTITAGVRATEAPIGGVSASVASCTDQAVVAKLITGADGNASRALPYGCYAVTLTAFPDGYSPLSPWTATVNPTAGNPDAVVRYDFRSGVARGPDAPGTQQRDTAHRVPLRSGATG